MSAGFCKPTIFFRKPNKRKKENYESNTYFTQDKYPMDHANQMKKNKNKNKKKKPHTHTHETFTENTLKLRNILFIYLIQRHVMKAPAATTTTTNEHFQRKNKKYNIRRTHNIFTCFLFLFLTHFKFKIQQYQMGKWQKKKKTNKPTERITACACQI